MKIATISLDARANFGYDTLLIRGEISDMIRKIAGEITNPSEVNAVDIVGATNTYIEYIPKDGTLVPTDSSKDYPLHKSAGDYRGFKQMLKRDGFVVIAGITPHRIIIVNSEKRLQQVNEILESMNYSIQIV